MKPYRHKPNILWICTDQQRFDTIHALGNRWIRTPNIDSLVAEGVSFNRAYCQSPVCSPSRASFLTGRYPRTTRVTKNGGGYFPQDEKLVTKMIADEGYTCGLAGKLHLSSADGRVEERPDDGYKVFHWSHAPRNDWGHANAYQEWLAMQGIKWEEQYKGDQGGIEARYHQTTWCVEEAMKFIVEHKEQPWMLSINMFDPHPPFDPPQEYRERYKAEDMPLPKWKEGELDNKPWLQQQDYEFGGQGGVGPSCKRLSDLEKKQYVADYYAMVELIDDQIGRLLQLLNETGLRENTVILFHSDHGEMLGDHGLIFKGAYFYEGLVHIPLIISWPGHFKENFRTDALVELVDLAPTILEIIGKIIPDSMQGKSLLPLLTGEADLHHHKDHVYSEYYYSLLGSHDDVYATMYLDGDYKLVIYHNRETGELYDMNKDPDEYQNLWTDPQYQEKKLELVLKSYDASVFTLDPNPPFVGKY